jgi:hypothetical protein
MSKFTQNGGMKIVINDIVSRENITEEQFVSIFQHTTNVEIVSTGSLTGFIIRATIPEEFSPFESDIIDSSGNLLEAEQYMHPATGVKLVDIIFKLCIVQPKNGPNIDDYNSANKGTCTLHELKDEYHTQRKVYDTSMSYGGIPICPDVITLLTFTATNFTDVFINPSSRLSAIFGANPVFQYLNTQVNKRNIFVTRSIGLIIMESLPSSYNPLRTLELPGTDPLTTAANKALFPEMAERVLANYLILFFRGGIIPLDAHMRNWMYDTSQQVDLFKIKAIDFGRVLERRTQLDKITDITRKYFLRHTSSSIRGFVEIMGCEPLSGNQDISASNVMRHEMIVLNRLIKYNQNGRILWEPDSYSYIPIKITDEKMMQIDSSMMLIHRIFVLCALIDSFYNFVNYEKEYCQMVGIFNVLFRKRCTNLDDMRKWHLGINLADYLNAMAKPDSKEQTILSYMRIKEYIQQYLEPTSCRGEFPDPLFEPLTPPPALPLWSPHSSPRVQRTSGSKSPSRKSGGGKKRKTYNKSIRKISI